MTNSLSSLIGVDINGSCKWRGTIVGADGSIYGVPANARRVIKFNPVDGSITFIGPNLGDAKCKWCGGVLAGNGIIYCIPDESPRILTIDTNTDAHAHAHTPSNVEIIDVLLPEDQDTPKKWMSGTVAPDGCIYFMPAKANRILKLKLSKEGDDFSMKHITLDSVGEDLGDGPFKYKGTVVGHDGYIYGIPAYGTRIVKYDQVSDTTSFVRAREGQHNIMAGNESFFCIGGSLARDGCIYAATSRGKVIQIDTVRKEVTYSFVGNAVESSHYGDGWGHPALGEDGCIYWPPFCANRVLKYDIEMDNTFLVGNDFGRRVEKWTFGALSPRDGSIYYIPCNANKVLSVNPLREFAMRLKVNMDAYPANLGFLFETNMNAKRNDDPNAVCKYRTTSALRSNKRSIFQKIREKTTNASLNILNEKTDYEKAIAKFGGNKVFQAIDMCIPHDDASGFRGTNLFPFMVAASCENCALAFIYHLLRRNPSALAHTHTRTCANDTVLQHEHNNMLALRDPKINEKTKHNRRYIDNCCDHTGCCTFM